MKKFILLILILVTRVLVSNCQNDDLLWLTHFSGAGQNQPFSIITDASGNIYVYGAFTTTVNQGTITLTSTGGQDLFLAKYNKNGNIIWLKQFGGIGVETPTGMALSKDNNFIYFAGQTNNTCSFDGNSITSAGGNDIFLAKYKTDGSFVWVHNTAYGTGQQIGGTISVDNNNNIVQAGAYVTNITFYGGVASLPGGAIRQLFITKYDSDGTLLWSKQLLSSNALNTDYISSISVYDYGYFFSGLYASTLTLDVGAITSTGGTDGFLYKTDINGNGLFVRKIAGTGSETINKHKGDKNGFQFLSGIYSSSTLIVDSITGVSSIKTYPNVGNNDIFYACYSPDGTLQYGRNYGSTGDDQGLAIFANENKIVLGGKYSEVINFDSFNLTFSGSSDAFIVEFDRNGNVLSANKANGLLSEQINSSNIDNDNLNLFVGEFYSDTLHIKGKTLIASAGGLRDMFIAKFGSINLSYSVTDVLCNSTSTGAIDISVTGNGTPPYTYSWAGPSSYTSTSEDITNLFAGLYNVTVTDAMGAVKTGNINISENPAMVLTASVIMPTCTPGSDGSIDLTVINGTGPLTYAWSNLAVTQDISTLVSGTYSITVTDANLCSVSGSYDVINPTAPQVFATKTDLTCVPGNDGEIDVLVSGGITPYTYLWNDAVITQDRTGLSAGSYIVTVTDAVSCSATTAAIVLSAAVLPSISFVNTNPTCVPGNDGAIDLIVYSGNPPYTYLWDNAGASTTQDITLLSENTYNVTVTDSNGCIISGTSVLSRQFPDATITPIGSTTICSGNSILLTANTGTGLTYQWQLGGVNIIGEVAVVYSATATGNYTLVVTASNGCSTTAAITAITVNPLPVATITPIGVTTFCSGDSVQLNANLGAGNTYQWQLNETDIVGETNQSYTANTIGNYTVVVTNNGCSNTSVATSVNVTSLPVANIVASGPISFCKGFSVILMATVGSGNAYQWQESGVNIPGAVSSAYTALSSGNYSVIVTNINGCSATSLETDVTVNPFPVLTFTVTNETCVGGNGAIDLTVSGGISPYTYSWNDLGSSTTEDLSGLSGGTYTVSVSDVSGCSSVNSATLTTIPILTASLVAHELIIFCESNNNGEATMIIQNGVAPYTYTWSGSASTSANVNDLGIGTNYVTVTDFCGTSIVDSIIVTSLPTLTASITASTQASCATSTNGSATVTTLNGIVPYNFLWSSSVSLTNVANDLVPGWQYVTVTDYCGSIIDSVEITSVPPLHSFTSLINQVTCVGDSNGIAVVSTTNGIPPITFIWTSSESNDTALTLAEGWNYVTITDGCGIILDSVQVTVIPPLSIALKSISIVSCEGGSNGSAVVTTTNGATPFTYLWNTGEVNDTSIFLVPEWNYITVTDACGSIIDSIEILVTPAVSASYEKPDGILCFGQSTASIEVTPIDGITPYKYTWKDTVLTTYNRINIKAGKYYFTVTDGCNSTYSDSVLINQPGKLILSAEKTNVSFIDLSDGSIDLSIYGGTPPFNYNWSNNVVIEDQNNITEGIYFITVTDNNGCEINDSIAIEINPWKIEIYKAFTPNGDGKNDVWNIKYISAYPNCEVSIFNEWGIKVFDSKGYTTPWDGKNSNNGKLLPAATYYYLIDLKDGNKVYTGSVALLK